MSMMMMLMIMMSRLAALFTVDWWRKVMSVMATQI